MGIDHVTGERVYSEGLLQLSYQDTTWMRDCEFDWNRDKRLKPSDPHKTILDPYKNLQCGMFILSEQIRLKGSLIMSSGEYWSTLRSRSRQLAKIIADVRHHMPLCN